MKDDAITAAETDALFGFRWTPHSSPTHTQPLLQMSWAQQEITEEEGEAVRYFYWAARNTPELATMLYEKPWVQDGITGDELMIIKYLYRIAKSEDNEPAAQTILGMPFLDSVAGMDALAVQSLERLEHDDTDTFLEIIEHPRIKDGITDDEAEVVVLLHAAPERFRQILKQDGGLHLERRKVQLPITGETNLLVAHFNEDNSEALNLLEAYATFIEGYMGEPFPSQYITLMFHDWESGRYHYGYTPITLKMSSWFYYDARNKNGRTAAFLARMVGWYYARDWDVEPEQRWVTSGFGTFMSDLAQVELGRDPWVWGGCAKASTLAALETIGTEHDGWTGCHRALGNQFMHALHGALGKETFQRGLRNLHRSAQQDGPVDGCDSANLTICHVVAAFKDGAEDNVAAQVDEVVARWYGPR